MKFKIIIVLVVLVGVWCSGVHVGKGLQREASRKRRMQRVENLTAFYKHKTKRPAYQRYAEKITDVIGEVFN